MISNHSTNTSKGDFSVGDSISESQKNASISLCVSSKLLSLHLIVLLSYHLVCQKTLVRVSKCLGLFFSQFMLEKLANLFPLSF